MKPTQLSYAAIAAMLVISAAASAAASSEGSIASADRTAAAGIFRSPARGDDSDDSNDFDDSDDRFIAVVGDDSDDRSDLDDSNDMVDEGTGLLSIKKNELGRFTGKLILGGKKFPLKGRFRADLYQETLRRGKAKVELNMELAEDGQSVSGSVSARNGQIFSLFAGGVNSYSRRERSPYAGNYTLVLPGAEVESASPYPAGNGFATMRVGKRGDAKVTATLADGTDFSFSTIVTNEGHMPFYSALYKDRGFAAGLVTFAKISGQSDAEAVLRIYKPEGLRKQSSFKKGFFVRAPLAASRFRVGKNDRVLKELNATRGLASILLGGTGFPTELAHTVKINNKNEVVLQDLAKGGRLLNLKINEKKGLFSGEFRPRGEKKPFGFQGVIFQAQGIGAGFFLNKGQSGDVSFEPVN